MRRGLAYAIIGAASASCSLLVDTTGLSGGGPVELDAGLDAPRGATHDAVAPIDGGSEAAAVEAGSGGPVSTGRAKNAHVTCKGGAATCPVPGNACCLFFTPMTDTCVSQAMEDSACMPTVPHGIIDCDDETDCAAGLMCCAVIGEGKTAIQRTKCVASCDAGEEAMCTAGGAPCGAGKTCQPMARVDAFNPGYGYRSCQ